MVISAYKAALIAGMTDAQFWASTPYLTRLHIEAATERERNAYRHDIFMAWHAGAFGRVKRMPSLEKAMRGIDAKRGPPRRMTSEEMLRQIEMWNTAFGGTDTRKPKPPTHAN